MTAIGHRSGTFTLPVSRDAPAERAATDRARQIAASRRNNRPSRPIPRRNQLARLR